MGYFAGSLIMHTATNAKPNINILVKFLEMLTNSDVHLLWAFKVSGFNHLTNIISEVRFRFIHKFRNLFFHNLLAVLPYCKRQLITHYSAP